MTKPKPPSLDGLKRARESFNIDIKKQPSPELVKIVEDSLKISEKLKEKNQDKRIARENSYIEVSR